LWFLEGPQHRFPTQPVRHRPDEDSQQHEAEECPQHHQGNTRGTAVGLPPHHMLTHASPLLSSSPLVIFPPLYCSIFLLIRLPSLIVSLTIVRWTFIIQPEFMRGRACPDCQNTLKGGHDRDLDLTQI